MNNHFLSRMLLRRYEDEKGKNHYIDISQKNVFTGKSKKLFSVKDIFSEELEQKMNTEIEGPAADIIIHKILPKTNTVNLNREETMKIRSFIVLQSVRSYYRNASFEQQQACLSGHDLFLSEMLRQLGYDELFPTEKNYML